MEQVLNMDRTRRYEDLTYIGLGDKYDMRLFRQQQANGFEISTRPDFESGTTAPCSSLCRTHHILFDWTVEKVQPILLRRPISSNFKFPPLFR